MTSAPTHAVQMEPFARAEPAGATTGTVGRLLRWLQCAVCAFHGHDRMLQYQRGRLYLQCATCGRETPGWEVATLMRKGA